MKYKANCPSCDAEIELNIAVEDGDWSDLEIWMNKLQKHIQSQTGASSVTVDVGLSPDGRFSVAIKQGGILSLRTAVVAGETIDEAIERCLIIAHEIVEPEINAPCEIIINGKSVTTQPLSLWQLSYNDVAKFYNGVAEPSGLLTITYRHGPDENREGSLLPGESVAIKPGMVFNASFTGDA